MSKPQRSPSPIHERLYGYQSASSYRPSLQSLSNLQSLTSSERRERYYDETKVERYLSGIPSMAEDNSKRLYEPMQPMRTSQDYSRRPEASTAASNAPLSLPSLRSMFPDHSSEAPRPSYHTRSPSYGSVQQEQRRIATPGESYIWNPSSSRPPSSHYSQDSQNAPSPKTDLPPPPPRSMMRQSETHTYLDPRHSPPSLHRPQPAPPAAYAPRTETSQKVFASRDTGSSFSIRGDLPQTLPQPPVYGRRESESRPSYSTASPVANSFSPPASVTQTEPLTTKDGLGPKIWTGTQFLPRFVRSAEVPGEGTCYFYDDGTHCKTHIDGEAVNAHWGVTKAGKPRKRLAIACITCREKKIKCDPDYPRCVQCEKFGRTCRFKNAPRGGQGPDSPPADAEDAAHHRAVPRSDAGSYTQSLSPTSVSHPSPEHEVNAAKRRRLGYNESTPIKSEYDTFHNTSPSNHQWAATNVAKHKERVTLKWPNNPYAADPALVKELVKVYFNNIASTAYSFIAEEPFMIWLESPEPKSSEDVLLIYALLAVATIFSSRTDRDRLGEEFAKTSRFAMSGSYTLQLVQTRFLFALYHEHAGSFERSWDALGGAIRTAMAIDLHVELPNAHLQDYPLELTKGSYDECRRRTFWSCYIMERLSSFRSARRICTISPSNVLLRMPGDNLTWSQGKVIENPFFTSDMDLAYNRSGTFGALAYLVIIVTIYSEITTAIWRCNQGIKVAGTDTFYDDISVRLERWNTSVPPCITFNKENVAKVTDFGMLGTFAAMHAVYHTAQLKLNSSHEFHTNSSLSPTSSPTSPSKNILQHPSPRTTWLLQSRDRLAMRHAETLIRDSSYLSIEQNKAIGTHEKACGKLPAFFGVALMEAMQFASGNGVGTMMGWRGDDALDVLRECSRTWPHAMLEGNNN